MQHGPSLAAPTIVSYWLRAVVILHPRLSIYLLSFAAFLSNVSHSVEVGIAKVIYLFRLLSYAYLAQNEDWVPPTAFDHLCVVICVLLVTCRARLYCSTSS